MIRTKRLTLRPLLPADADRIAALGGEWDVASMTGRIPYPYSADAAQHWLTGVAEGEVVFVIERAGELIGICGYTPREERGAEMGYWLGKPYWGQGLATEAASALMSYGFSKGRVKQFTCCHFTDNPSSGRVLAKLGFRPTGMCSGWCEARQQELPTVTYTRRRPWTNFIKALAS